MEIGTLTIRNADDIETIMPVLSTANRISRNAMNKQPFVQDLLNVFARKSYYFLILPAFHNYLSNGILPVNLFICFLFPQIAKPK